MRIAVALLFTLPFVATAQEPTVNTGIADVPAHTHSSPIPTNHAIDFAGFVKLTQSLQQVRESRRISIEKFNEMASDPKTIILDTRSKRAFDVVHVAGAVHLNFSDFTAAKLAKVIPDNQTRILIYCNNNFIQANQTGFEARAKPQRSGRRATGDTNGDGAVDERDRKEKEEKDVIEGTTNKLPPLALNIPTFVNLHGYGYTNVYELADQLELNDERLTLAKGRYINRR
ncbi:MAG: rhodanese-like domain-containing protein [Pirellulaceae bacterium]